MFVPEETVRSLLDETLVPFTKAKSLPGEVTFDKLCWWRDKGIKVQGQHLPVTLECCKIGGTWHTSKEAFQRFVIQTNQ